MGARRVKNCGRYYITDTDLLARTSEGKSVWLEKLKRDKKSRIAKKEKRKEIRQRNKEALR